MCTIAGMMLVSCSLSKKDSEEWELPFIPDIEDVGAANLPEQIAPVNAPFRTINFKKPNFPSDTISLKLTIQGINTQIIQQEIDRLSQQGGGVVFIPKGEWLSGRIQLKDNINLHLDEGAVLKFSGEIEDYQPAVFTRIEGIEVMSLGACIYASGAKNIALTGNGRLIGPAQGSVREKILTTKVIDNVIDPDTPVKDRIADGIHTPYIFPPMFISPINCENVYIEGVSLEQTAFWNIVPVYCNNVIIRGVTVNSVGIPRGDGIDVESSRNVLIEYSTLSCGDDCFTMKAGRGPDGIRVNKPTENVVVRYCLAKTGHGGITCGSETAGTIRNLYVHDCVFENTGVGIRFKTRRPRGGGGENLTYERLRMNLRYTAFKWDMLGSPAHVGDLAKRFPVLEVNALTPKYENIHAKDLIIENATHFVKVLGIPESPLNKLTIENVKVNCTNFFIAQDMKNSTFKNIDITADDSVLILDNVQEILFDNVNFQTTHSPVQLKINDSRSDSVRVTDCFSIKDTLYLKIYQND